MSTAHEYHEEEALGKAYDARLMRRLLTYLRPHRKSVILATVLLILTSLLELVGPFLTKMAIDDAIAHKDTRQLIFIAGLYLLSLLGGLALGYWSALITQRVGQQIMLTLRVQIFSHLTRLHVAYFDRNPVGRLLTRLTSDVEALNDMFTSGVVAIFGDIIMLLGIMGMLLVLDVKLALVSFAVLPLLFALSLWFRNNVRETYREVRIRLARMNAYLQEAITGMSVLQIMNHEAQSVRDFNRLNRAHTQVHLRSIFYYATFYPGVEIISSLALALVIWVGGGSIIANTFTLGGLVAFIQYVGRFYRPIEDLSDKYNILQAAMASSERVFQLLDTPPAIVDPQDGHAPPPVDATLPLIEFRNVWFAYLGEDWVLRDVSFSVNRGETVAFVGATGSGKTTIMSLLMRFYDVQKGAVLVDGRDVREWNQAALRRRMSLVLQDVFLFSGSVAENIRMGQDGTGADAERIESATRTVNAAGFVSRFPRGFDTELGERGASLSTGQKQLLSFARALYHDPEILILDEATSNVDAETEVLIQEALKRLLQGRTSLVVAHRLSTVRNANRIILLHKGCIRESGTHQELLRERGLYYRLYLLQYQDQEALAAGRSTAS